MRTTLLVEDASFFEKAIVNKLKDVGRNQVMVARTYQEAKNCLDLPIGEPDLALVDLTLPDAPDGQVVDLCRERNIPTIVFTSRFDVATRDKVLAKGVIDYVLKDTPGSLDYVADLLRRLSYNPNIGILILDDSSVEREALAKIVSHHLYRVYQAGSSSEALEVLRNNSDIKLVLADYFMPEEDGFSFLKSVRRKYSREALAVIGMSSYSEPQNRIRFLKYGAVDFIEKNYSPEEILLRISLNLDVNYRIEELNKIAMQDALTGLYNRHYLFGEGSRRTETWSSTDENESWIAVFDLDSFKEFNDEYGHDVGDSILYNFSRHLTALAGDQDHVVRLGGDEFCVIFQSEEEASVMVRLSSFLKKIETSPLRYNDNEIAYRTSVGIARIVGADLEAALRSADKNLYQAKRTGRGRLVSAE